MKKILTSFLLLSILCMAPLGDAFAARIRGVVELGNDAFPGLTGNKAIVLYEATEGAPIVRGFAKTNANGQFIIHSFVDQVDGIFYLQAFVGAQVSFITVLGDTLPFRATLNELTTVAGAYSMAQFLHSGSIMGDPFRLNIAAAMNRNLVNPATGQSSEVLSTSPNADETSSWRMTHSLANIVNLAAVYPFVANYLMDLTRIEGDPLPANTVVALANLARDPGNNASALWQLTQYSRAYRPRLQEQPDAWCVTVKVNNSGNDNFLIAGPANVAFDDWGYAWVTNNVVQGTPNSGNFLVVLKPDGSPADGQNGTPNSPIFGGGLLGGGWGITIDQNNTVWASNFGWGGEPFWPDLLPAPGNTGSVTTIRAEDGTVLSQPDGLFGDVWRAQAIKHDANGNIWITGFENDKIIFWPNGDSTQFQSDFQYMGSSPFGLDINPDGSVWMTNSGGLGGENESSLTKYAIVNGRLEVVIPYFPLGNTLKSVVSDSQGNAWVASQGDDTVYAIAPDGQQLGAYRGGGVNGPWGLAVDGEENIWVANFGPLRVNDRFSPGRISKIAGANPAGWPAGKTMGDPLSPATGYTVVSAGAQVLLANGEPLYGSDSPLVSFTPLMRLTSVQIDAAGNVWAINNWKPAFDIDATVNPGGDGIVIFVGIAPPPRR